MPQNDSTRRWWDALIWQFLDVWPLVFQECWDVTEKLVSDLILDDEAVVGECRHNFREVTSVVREDIELQLRRAPLEISAIVALCPESNVGEPKREHSRLHLRFV